MKGIQDLQIEIDGEKISITHPMICKGSVLSSTLYNILVDNIKYDKISISINNFTNTIILNTNDGYIDDEVTKALNKIKRIMEDFLLEDGRYKSVSNIVAHMGKTIFAKDVDNKVVKLDNLYKTSSFMSDFNNLMITIINGKRHLLYMNNGEIFISTKLLQFDVFTEKIFDLRKDIMVSFEDLFNSLNIKMNGGE